MRPNVRSHHRLTTIHQKDNTSTPPTRQFNAQGRNCSDTCLDTEMPHARGVGEEEAAVIVIYRHLRLTSYDFRLSFRDYWTEKYDEW
jgi:hypothetical protein